MHVDGSFDEPGGERHVGLIGTAAAAKGMQAFLLTI
jgi:hypothetical protein